MTWQGIEGHDQLVTLFQNALKHNRLASTFLFVGDSGIGKRMFALKLAQTLQCKKNPPWEMTPCGICSDCLQILSNTHPDIHQIALPPDRAFIPLELFIGEKENRMRTGLCHNISMAPFSGRRKIAIIDDADYLNSEGANCLLKTLEEPPPGAIIILLGSSASRQLPTIRSRCQIIRFAPLSENTIAQILLKTGVTEDPDHAQILAKNAGGSITRAREMADPDFWNFRSEFLQKIAEGPRERFSLGKSIESHLEQTVKLPAAKRAKIRLIMEMTADFFRLTARFLCSGSLPPDSWLAGLIRQAAELRNSEEARRMAEISLYKIEILQRNVHIPSLLDEWLDEIIINQDKK